jgi:hypothetical protein
MGTPDSTGKDTTVPDSGGVHERWNPTWVAVGSTSIRRVTSGAPAMEMLGGHQHIPLPPPASPVNYRRVLRAVHASVDPLAAAVVVASAEPVRITLFADMSVLAEYEYSEPSLDQEDRMRWFGHDAANRGNSKIMLDVPAALADPTRIEVYGAVVVANRLFGIDPASTLQPDAPAGAVIVREYEPQPQPR